MLASALSTVLDIAIWLVDAFKTIGKVASIAADAAGWVFNPVGSAIEAFAGEPEEKLAEGGIVTGPTRALIGEAGPEAVIPLRGAAGQLRALEAGGFSPAGAGGADLAQAIKQAIKEGFMESSAGGAGSNQPVRNIELKLDHHVLGRILDDHFDEKVSLKGVGY
jgi:hypothetical protein